MREITERMIASPSDRLRVLAERVPEMPYYRITCEFCGTVRHVPRTGEITCEGCGAALVAVKWK